MNDMNENLIYLCDLTHTSQGYATELAPYPVACIKSWLLHYSRFPDRFQVEVFKAPQVLLDALVAHEPAVVGFSNYMWNLDISYSIAKEIKALNPETIVIFGGPNYPLEDHAREQWLKDRPAIDAYIIGEGEEPFTYLMDAWQETGDIKQNPDTVISEVSGFSEGFDPPLAHPPCAVVDHTDALRSCSGIKGRH